MASRSRAAADVARPALATRVRAWRRVVVIALLLAVHVGFHWLWRAFGARSPWPRSFLRWTSLAAGIDVRVVGTPVLHDVLYVSNHVTWFDIPVIAGVTGARFVSKDDVARWPAVGTLARMNRTVFIARTARGEVAAQAAQLRDALDEGTPVALFPEGGTGDGTVLKPFRAPLFSALVAPGPVPLVLQPVAVDYGTEQRLMAWAGRGTGFGAEMIRLMGLKGRRKVTLTFLPPLDPVAVPDRKQLAARAYDAVAGALGLGGVKPV